MLDFLNDSYSSELRPENSHIVRLSRVAIIESDRKKAEIICARINARDCLYGDGKRVLQDYDK
jgi:hypothetical protein